MADVETQAPRQPDTELPEYLTDSNATLRDKEAVWRYGSAPDYSKTRKVYEESKQPPRLFEISRYFVDSA